MSTKDLFKITEGARVWTFTSSNEPETYNGETYESRICGRGEIPDNATIGKNELEMYFPLLDDIAQHFLKSPVDFVARLDLIVKDETGAFTTEWRGKLTKTIPDDKKIRLNFNSIFSANKRVGARPVYQRACRHTVYGPGCGLSYAAHKSAATVTAISADGLTLTIPEAAALPAGPNGQGLLNGGIVEFPDGTMRYVASHSGSTVKIIRVSPSLLEAFAEANPVNVFIAPGCNQTTSWCAAVFDNLLNHGGFPYIPLKNPTRSAVQ